MDFPMRIFPPVFEVTLDEGFSPEKDLFGRAPIANGLTRIVESVDQPMVIALDGDWGSGKTTFLRFWTGELRKAGFPVVFFDAFQDDYADDAFIALAGEVFSLLEQNRKGKTRKAKKFAEKAVGAGKVLLRSGLKIGVKAATMGALNAGDLDDLAGAVSDESADIFDENIGELITRQVANRDAISEFKSALSALPALLSPPDDGEKQKPLIFIIDELDRCRPSFALELLERVKHFFSVQDVHFVLGLNSDQLLNSVRSVYGAGIDARTYLQKFIHLTWTLSQRERYAADRARTKYVRYLVENMGWTGRDAQVATPAMNLVGAVAELRGLSFRSIERALAAVALAVATTPETTLRQPALIGGLALMKVLEPSLFNKAKTSKLNFEEVKNFLLLEELDKDSEYSWGWATSWWQFVTDPNPPEELIQGMRSELFTYNVRDRMDVLTHTADVVMDNVTLR